MTVKYIIHPGEVRSSVDHDIHWVSPFELMSLYGVDPEACVIFPRSDTKKDLYAQFPDAMRLYPSSSGNYTLRPTTKKESKS